MDSNIENILGNLPLLPELTDIIRQYDDDIERKYANCLCCSEHISLNPGKRFSSWSILSECDIYEMSWGCECTCQCVNTLAMCATNEKWGNSELFKKM